MVGKWCGWAGQFSSLPLHTSSPAVQQSSSPAVQPQDIAFPLPLPGPKNAKQEKQEQMEGLQCHFNNWKNIGKKKKQ